MKLVACTPPEGFLESAPLSPLCDAIVTTNGSARALSALEAFWCWDDDRYYVRQVVRDALPDESHETTTTWYCIADSDAVGVLVDDALTPRRTTRSGQRSPAMRVRVARGRGVAAMALSLGIPQRRNR